MKTKLLIVLAILITNTCWADEMVTIAYFQSKPHMIFDTSTRKIYGALYTFLEEYIAPKMGVKFVWNQTPSNVPREIELLTTESVDAVALLVYSPDRAEKFCYTRNPYYATRSVVGVLNTSTLTKVEKIEDIVDLRIGYVAKTYISPFMRDPRVKFDYVSSSNANEHNLKKLQLGRVDAIYIPDKAALLNEMHLLNIDNKIRVIDLPETPANAHVVFSKKNRALADRFDKAYNEIDGANVYRALLGQYLDINRL